MHQSIGASTHLSIKHAIDQWINSHQINSRPFEPINETINESIYRSIDQSSKQASKQANQSTNQLNNRLVKQ